MQYIHLTNFRQKQYFKLKKYEDQKRVKISKISKRINKQIE